MIRSPRTKQRGFLLNPCRFGSPGGGGGGFPMDGYVTSQLHFDDLSGQTVPDIKGSTWTKVGSAAISATQSKFGGSSLQLTVAGSTITTPYSASWDLLPSGFTFEAWVYPLDFGASGRRIFSTGSGYIGWNSTTGIHTLVQFNSLGQLQFQMPGTSFVGLSYASANVAKPNVWSFITVSYNPVARTVSLGINGAMTTLTTAAHGRPSSNPSAGIGLIPGSDSTALTFYGYIDDCRISKGIARYAGNSTVVQPTYALATAAFPENVTDDPHWGSVTTLLHMDGADGSIAFPDSSTSSLTFTRYGNTQIDTDQSVFGGASALFDNSGDYLTTPSSAAVQLNDNDFTVEFALRSASLPSDADFPVAKFSSYNESYWFQVTAGAAFGFQISTDGKNAGTLGTFTANGAIALNIWYRVAGVYKKAEKCLALYVDGTFISKTLVPNIYAGTAVLAIGRSTYSGYPYDYHGHIDELRITKGVARYDISLAALYDLPTAAFSDS